MNSPTDDASADARQLTPEQAEAFVQELTAAQLGLLRYIATLLGNPQEANDVLQATNVVLWRKASEFELGTSFRAWSERVAYFQTRAFIRDRGRDRHVFSEEMVSHLASRTVEAIDDRQIALRHCLSGLEPRQRDLLRLRYADEIPLKQLAERQGKGLSAMKVGLHRLRRSLLDCIERKLSEAV
ncbi:MAG: sigma-70 family RNA polymerase sigma factor [Planctomycetota bacterium]